MRGATTRRGRKQEASPLVPSDEPSHERGTKVSDSDISHLAQAAAERQLAVTALQQNYAESVGVPTEQQVLDMRESCANV